MDRFDDVETRNPTGVLTVDERETLRVALETGYFGVPRTATLDEVADELGRSNVESSQQLRRGMATVLRATNVLDDPAVVADGGTGRPLDRLFDALSHPYRRRILTLVSERESREEGGFSIGALATEDDDLELLTTELYHAHLPMLADAGYIEWESDGETVHRGSNFEEIEPVLRLMTEHRDELPDGWP
ncbi:helix-turn-helix domain-containing protein [Salinirubrum litoreum]|uniref:Helix-turn-helix domain-containing protein n=1 Tax=Salinirubrum litoreum TaxID=1126234 RepID=A0ABD5RGB7_9EURY|nr:helix-turn-helix domain-containing protein [Salinirubrum litoreum]